MFRSVVERRFAGRLFQHDAIYNALLQVFDMAQPVPLEAIKELLLPLFEQASIADFMQNLQETHELCCKEPTQHAVGSTYVPAPQRFKEDGAVPLFVRPKG